MNCIDIKLIKCIHRVMNITYEYLDLFGHKEALTGNFKSCRDTV